MTNPLAVLVERWRETAKQLIASYERCGDDCACEVDEAQTMNDCADELSALLSEASVKDAEASVGQGDRLTPLGHIMEEYQVRPAAPSSEAGEKLLRRIDDATNACPCSGQPREGECCDTCELLGHIKTHLVTNRLAARCLRSGKEASGGGVTVDDAMVEALRHLMWAYERKFRSDPSFVPGTEPWVCLEYRAAQAALEKADAPR
jgi:hypothetical protein